MAETKFDLSGVTLANMPATAVPNEIYYQLYGVEYDAMADATGFTPDEIGYYLRDRDDYSATRRQPNLLVEQGRVNPGQSYRRPEITIAYADNKAVGYAYCADNISHDSPKELLIKQLTIVKNYRWLRMIAVHPEYQNRGIGHLLAYKAYTRLIPGQPASAYTWPELLTRNNGLLLSWGFNPTNLDNPKYVKPFGEQMDPTPQIRYEAKRASSIGKKLASVLLANTEGVNSPMELVVEHSFA